MFYKLLQQYQRSSQQDAGQRSETNKFDKLMKWQGNYLKALTSVGCAQASLGRRKFHPGVSISLNIIDLHNADKNFSHDNIPRSPSAPDDVYWLYLRNSWQ